MSYAPHIRSLPLCPGRSPNTLTMSAPRIPAAFSHPTIPLFPTPFKSKLHSLTPYSPPCPTHTAPPLRRTPPPPHASTSSQAHSLRKRIASVQAAEKIVSALRLVSAARIRAYSSAALRTRPFAEEVQRMLAALLREVHLRNIDAHAVAHRASPGRVSEISGDVLADPVVQKALLDRMYLSLMEGWGTQNRGAQSKGVTVLAIITADRGFCGGYNKDVLGKAERRMMDLRKSGHDVELVVVGQTGRLFFERNYPRVPIRCFREVGRLGSAEETAAAVSHALLAEFIAGGVERVEVVYTRFVSLISSMPSARTLLPLTPTGMEAVGDELFELRLTTENGKLKAQRTAWGDIMNGQSVGADSFRGAAYGGNGRGENSQIRSRLTGSFYNISDEEAILLLNSMLPMYVTSQLIRIVREAIASEQASRLYAMTAATDNAREIVTSLRAQYNKARQARITTEIIEVVSNANA